MYTKVFYLHFDGTNNTPNPRRRAGGSLDCGRLAVSHMYQPREGLYRRAVILNGINEIKE